METSTRTVNYFKFQQKVNTLLGMPFYVNSTEKLGMRFGKFLTTSYQYFTEIIVIVVTIGQYWAVPHVSENMNVLCGCLSSSAHSTQTIAKTALLNLYKKRFVDHLEKAHSVQELTDRFERSVFGRETSEFYKYYQKQSRYVNIIVIVQLVINFASTSAYFLPFVYDAIINHEEVRNQLTPIVIYIGIDFNYTPLFQFIVIILTVAFYVCNLKTVVIDNFLLSMIVLHMSQLRYHDKLLREMIESRDLSIAGNEVDEGVIRLWIRQHQALLRLCDSFRELLSPYLFFEFAYVLIHTCVPAFVITSTFSWTLPQKIAVFCMVGGGLIELFLMSNAGDVFSDAWSATGNVLFQSEFFFKDEKWLKHTLIIIRKRLQRPLRLAALNIVPLSCTTFVTILRLIFSYYMTLNQIQKMKHNDRGWSNDEFSIEA